MESKLYRRCMSITKNATSVYVMSCSDMNPTQIVAISRAPSQQLLAAYSSLCLAGNAVGSTIGAVSAGMLSGHLLRKAHSQAQFMRYRPHPSSNQEIFTADRISHNLLGGMLVHIVNMALAFYLCIMANQYEDLPSWQYATT